MELPSFGHDYGEDEPLETEICKPSLEDKKPQNTVRPPPTRSFLCEECKRKFLSKHILDLHLEEAHSAFFQLAVERKKPGLYACLESTCSHRSDSPAERATHWKENHSHSGDPEPPFYLHNRKRKQRQSKAKKREKNDRMED